MKDTYNWVMDSREGPGKLDPVFLNMAKDNGWVIKPLRLSSFIPLPKNQPDLDCGDFTNENGDGIVEFKSFADYVGSTTGDGVNHMEEQAIKMHATGLPRAVICYGSRDAFQLESGVSDDLILSGLQKGVSVCSIFKIAQTFVKNENEAIETAKTFIRHCNRLPYALPALHLLKRGGCRAVGFYVGIDLIGEKTAKVLAAAWSCPAELGKFILDELPKALSIERVATMVKDKTPGLRIDQAISVVITFIEGNSLVKKLDPIETSITLPDMEEET